MVDNLKPPFPESYWVIPGKFLAGEYPYSKSEEEGRKKLGQLLQSGIRAFVDLTMPGDEIPYSNELIKLSDKMGIHVEHRHFAIPDMDVPEITTMKAILNWIEEQIVKGNPIYLHCYGGIGRTGTVVGCYLVRQGVQGQEALERISYLRRDTSSWWYVVPETWLQKDYILKWKPGE